MAAHPPHLILYHHQGCCLCARLEDLLHQFAQREKRLPALILEKRDIAGDENWRLLYRERIPVLTDDTGQVLLEGRPEEAQVQQLINRLADAQEKH